MCIIIDANVADEIVATSDDAKPILRRIQAGRLKMVAGHKLKRELMRTRFRGLYQQLVLAGKLTEFTDQQIEKAANEIDRKLLASNDLHVLGLARASGARILFSKDEPLHSDFKNKDIIVRPRGKVYTSRNHEKLLDEGECTCN
jgi:hypothetical protein